MAADLRAVGRPASMGRPPKPVDESTYRGQVGARIRARRVRLKLDVVEAARRAACPEKTWYNWETGRGNFPIDALPVIAAALSCAPRSLLPPD